MIDLSVLSAANTIQVNAGRPWGLVCDVAVWTIRSRTALDQTRTQASLEEAALLLVSSVARVDITRRTVPSYVEVKGRVVETMANQARAGQLQTLGFTSCPVMTVLPGRWTRSLVISEFDLFTLKVELFWSGT